MYDSIDMNIWNRPIYEDSRIRVHQRHGAKENEELLINGTEILSGVITKFGNRTVAQNCECNQYC